MHFVQEFPGFSGLGPYLGSADRNPAMRQNQQPVVFYEIFMKFAESSEKARAALGPPPDALALCGPHGEGWPEIWVQSVLYKNKIGPRSRATPWSLRPPWDKGVPQTIGPTCFACLLNLCANLDSAGTSFDKTPPERHLTC